MNVWMKNEILKLKKEKNAAILAHYYAPEEVQELADYFQETCPLVDVGFVSGKQAVYDFIISLE